jgi:hypothetical protein
MAAEAQLAREFPELYAFCTANEVRRPQRDEHWENLLSLARNSEPILNDLALLLQIFFSVRAPSMAVPPGMPPTRSASDAGLSSKKSSDG